MSVLINPYRFASGGATDPHFANVVFLSGFEGNNGGQVFTDESSYGHTLTASGPSNVLGTYTSVKRFGSSSLYRQATLSVLKVSSPADFNLGSSAFTLETWVNFSDAPTSSFHPLFGQWDSGANQRSWALGLNGGVLSLFATAAGGTTATKGTFTWSPSTSTWYHVAADFDGSKYRLYVDGSMVGSATGVITLFASTAVFAIGSVLNSGNANGAFTGYLDETRITKGFAHYASDSGFTVPTAAFPRS